MPEEKFAFEFPVPSLAFQITSDALGDSIISKCAFEALIKLVPNCKVDIFYSKDSGKRYAQSFYSDSKNLNILINRDSYKDLYQKYDLAVTSWHTVFLDAMNEERLKSLCPNLFNAAKKIRDYNKKQPYKQRNDTATILANFARAHILGTNRYTSSACNGALPIQDEHVHIPLTAEGERGFKDLNLKSPYITIGSISSQSGSVKRHFVKEWSRSHSIEYISLLNVHMPEIKIVQVGGGGVLLFPNADRYVFDADLEVVKYVLKNSLLHVDCESGLVHLATQLGTKCLVLFGPTDEKYYGFKENFNVSSDVCYPCCWAWDSGKECLLGAKEPPCMTKIKPQQVFEITRSYLSRLEKNKA